MRALLAVSLVLSSATVTSVAFADEPPRCTVVKVNDIDVSVPVDVSDVSLRGTPEIFCKTRSRKLAEKELVSRKGCKELGKGQNRYVVTWGIHGKETRFELAIGPCRNK